MNKLYPGIRIWKKNSSHPFHARQFKESFLNRFYYEFQCESINRLDLTDNGNPTIL